MRFGEGHAWFLSVDFADDNSNMMLIRLGDPVESLPYPLLWHTQWINVFVQHSMGMDEAAFDRAAEKLKGHHFRMPVTYCDVIGATAHGGRGRISALSNGDRRVFENKLSSPDFPVSCQQSKP